MMGMVTTRHSDKPKPFTWSYSKLKSFESCPKRHLHLDILKDVKEEDSDQLTWGNYVHKSLAERIEKSIPLPKGMEEYEIWCEKILQTDDPDTKILVEQKLAITKDFDPCSYFDNNVWFRSVGDVIKISSNVALIADWKTGKILEDGAQLALAAQCVFSHYPSVLAVRSEFIWLKEDATTSQVFRKGDMPAMWNGIFPRIRTLEHAAESMNYPPKPGGLCKRFCPVTQCPHHGG
jgi:hypothetical protein